MDLANLDGLVPENVTQRATVLKNAGRKAGESNTRARTKFDKRRMILYKMHVSRLNAHVPRGLYNCVTLVCGTRLNPSQPISIDWRTGLILSDPT